MDIMKKIAAELGVRANQVEAAVKLIDEGCTIPFIARYRKEATGALNDEQLRDLYDRLVYLRNLEEKKQTVLASIEEQGKLTGRLSREELSGLLGTCDAFVLASFAETFGIVFIEAMATGLPAIGTVCGGPEDIITPESGFLIRPGNVDALAAKMKTLYDTYESFDKEKIRQSIVSRFDFQLAGQKLRQVYSEALEMSKPPKASES